MWEYPERADEIIDLIMDNWDKFGRGLSETTIERLHVQLGNPVTALSEGTL